MLRTQLYADPSNVFVHDAVLASCRRNPQKTALVDTSCGRRLTYAEYGEIVEALAQGLGGTIDQRFGPHGATAVLIFPAETDTTAIP